jgi:ATP-binding cassette subfamily B multidrug efflux pump
MGKPLYQKIKKPANLLSYWSAQLPLCLAITLTGFLYNFGMLASPYFEGRIVDVIEAKSPLADVLTLIGIFIGVIAFVLLARALKRYTVRRFANNTTLAMRLILENNILHRSLKSGEDSGVGSLLAKVISDVEATVEGMRKLTTEIFDTVVMFFFYIIFLFLYDATMTLYALIPVGVAILVAFLMRKAIFRASSSARKANSNLSNMTYDLFDNAITYRIYGRDEDHAKAYDGVLKDYEKKTVKSLTLTDLMIPLAEVIAMLGLIPVFILGPEKVVAAAPLSAPINGLMNSTWTLGAFTTYLTTFVLMATKASKTAKLFGSIEKGLASWKRIRPLITPYEEYRKPVEVSGSPKLSISHLRLTIEDKTLLSDFSFEAEKGQIIGITGPIASGKSAFAKLFFQILPYEGSLVCFGKEVRDYAPEEIAGSFLYMPHHNELFTDSIKNNIALGEDKDVLPYLADVSFQEDLNTMAEKENTIVGNEGVKLSGGQQERLALARSLYHRKSLLILDDPFASVDPKTEQEILSHLRETCGDSLVLLISHRLTSFKNLDNIVVFHGDGTYEMGKEKDLLSRSDLYRTLYSLQNDQGKEPA